MTELIQRFIVGVGLVTYTCGCYIFDLHVLFALIPIMAAVSYDLLFLISGPLKPSTGILIGYEIFGTYLFYLLATQDRWLTISSTLTIAFSDIFQYLAGKYVDGRKVGIGPSPNKTFIGYLAGFLVIPLSPVNSAFVLILVGMFGDLFVSVNKRQLHIKDISNLLGSHGGWLDRVDGVYMGYVYLYFFYLV